MPELPPHLRAGLTDSAGQPWEGRTFGENPWQDDDGSTPVALGGALRAFRAGEASPSAVVDALRETRLLVPLVAELGEEGENEQGVKVDKSADLSIVTVKAPDGRGVVPVFSSVDAMRRWDAEARPVPVDSRRAALAAVDEGNELLILDPGSEETEFVVRRPAVWAISQAAEYELPWQDAEVMRIARSVLAADDRILGIDLLPGDPGCVFAGPELVFAVQLDEELEQDAQREVLETVQRLLAGSEELVRRVDSLVLRVDRVRRDPLPSKDARTPRAGLFGRRRRR